MWPSLGTCGKQASLLMLSLLISGCALADAGRDITHTTLGIFRPRPTDHRDPANFEDDFVDEHASVGIEARGDRSRERESDWFTRYESPKTRAINKNLGID